MNIMANDSNQNLTTNQADQAQPPAVPPVAPPVQPPIAPPVQQTDAATVDQNDNVLDDLEALIAQAQQKTQANEVAANASNAQTDPEAPPIGLVEAATDEELAQIAQLKQAKEQETQARLAQQQLEIQQATQTDPVMEKRAEAKQEEAGVTAQNQVSPTAEIRQLSHAIINKPE